MRRAAASALLLLPAAAQASFLSGEALDTAANVLSWIVIVLVPIVVIGLFFYVHVLPEVIAERRHHPQKQAIKTLCILSLFFGGLLWPLAWLWAYTRPVMFRAAYGSERHEDYYVEMEEKAREGKLSQPELLRVRAELTVMAEQGNLPPALQEVRRKIDEHAALAEAEALRARQAALADERAALEGSVK